MLNGFMLKTFILENEVNYHSFTLQIPIPTNLLSIDIELIVNMFRRVYPIGIPQSIKVYDPLRDRYIDISSEEIADRAFLYSPMIMIKYTPAVANEEQQEVVEGEEGTPVPEKKERNKERTVREVLTCVKKWRESHNTLNRNREKVNLQEAAKQLGVTKKSLDDYYSQLRLAEKYGFNFYENIDKRIGVLRSFVKANRQKDGGRFRYEKLPKSLKIINEFDPASYKAQSCQIFVKIEDEEYEEQEERDTIMDSYEGVNPTIPAQNEVEKCFYRSFNFMMDDPDNPFSRATGRKKKAMLQHAEQQFVLF